MGATERIAQFGRGSNEAGHCVQSVGSNPAPFTLKIHIKSTRLIS